MTKNLKKLWTVGSMVACAYIAGTCTEYLIEEHMNDCTSKPLAKQIACSVIGLSIGLCYRSFSKKHLK